MISAAHPPSSIDPSADASAITVVVSKGQSRNPAKRALEQAIADAAGSLEGVDVVVVPHLYDLPKDGESVQRLRSITGDIVLASWIFPRAAHWVLDRNGVGGHVGEVELGETEEEEPEELLTTNESDSSDRDVDRVTDLYPRPDRSIYCLDLKVSETTADFVGELQRIIGLADGGGDGQVDGVRSTSLPIVGGKIEEVTEDTSRRWYPVIDFSRCTNCMECIDFCLFGVYGVDGVESILVEQPDNCRKGCPACSRVCPENAIIFPQHKAPAIAGAEVAGEEGFKIDLSQLFGAPVGGDDPIATAARERDEQLLLAGRDVVGIDDKLRKRQESLATQPKDQLDDLIDSLDELDL